MKDPSSPRRSPYYLLAFIVACAFVGLLFTPGKCNGEGLPPQSPVPPQQPKAPGAGPKVRLIFPHEIPPPEPDEWPAEWAIVVDRAGRWSVVPARRGWHAAANIFPSRWAALLEADRRNEARHPTTPAPAFTVPFGALPQPMLVPGGGTAHGPVRLFPDRTPARAAAYCPPGRG